MVSVVRAKCKDQQGSKKKDPTNPKVLAYPRFLLLMLGDDLIGNSTKGNPLPKADKPAKEYRIKSHNLTIHSDGYDVCIPLPNGLLEYLDGEEREYRGLMQKQERGEKRGKIRKEKRGDMREIREWLGVILGKGGKRK